MKTVKKWACFFSFLVITSCTFLILLHSEGPPQYKLKPVFRSYNVSETVASNKTRAEVPPNINHSNEKLVVRRLATNSRHSGPTNHSNVKLQARRPTTNTEHSGPTKILVVSQFRSGSTYFSEMFNFNPDAFYMFEPLIYLLLPKNQTLTLLNGSIRAIHDVNKKEYITSTIDDILNCRLKSLSVWYLRHTFLGKSKQFLSYRDCIKPVKEADKDVLSFCVQYLINMCKSAKVRVIKTIRYRITVEGITALRQTNTRLKVIYLGRDPRGRVLSTFDATGSETANIALKSITNCCHNIERDLNAIQIINNRTENKILTVNYEDMAENPSTFVSSLYSFLDLKVPTLALVGVLKQSLAKHNNTKFGTARENSTITAYAWKRKITYDMVKTIDTCCSSWYPLLGYLPINSRKELADPDNKHRVPHPSVLT